MVVLLYHPETRATGLRGARWAQHMQQKYGPPQGGLNIHATPLEQKLLLKLLSMNGKALSPSYTPEKDAIEQHFRASFLLPLGPLSYQDIGKLNNDPGWANVSTVTGFLQGLNAYDFSLVIAASHHLRCIGPG